MNTYVAFRRKSVRLTETKKERKMKKKHSGTARFKFKKSDENRKHRNVGIVENKNVGTPWKKKKKNRLLKRRT